MPGWGVKVAVATEIRQMILNLFLAFVIATGYCNASCDKPPTHPAYGITASGTRTHEGTIACPPEWDFGTKVFIPGEGRFVCEDRGGAIKGNRIDIYFPTCDEALEWGVQEKPVIVMEELF